MRLLIFKMAVSRFVDVAEKKIDIREEKTIQKGTKDASKSRVTLFEGKT